MGLAWTIGTFSINSHFYKVDCVIEKWKRSPKLYFTSGNLAPAFAKESISIIVLLIRTNSLFLIMITFGCWLHIQWIHFYVSLVDCYDLWLIYIIDFCKVHPSIGEWHKSVLHKKIEEGQCACKRNVTVVETGLKRHCPLRNFLVALATLWYNANYERFHDGLQHMVCG